MSACAPKKKMHVLANSFRNSILSARNKKLSSLFRPLFDFFRRRLGVPQFLLANLLNAFLHVSDLKRKEENIAK